MIEKYLGKLRKDCRDQKRYFHDAEGELADLNIRILREISLALSVLVIFFILLTPAIIPNWTVTPQHLLLIPSALVFYLFTLYYREKPKKSYLVSKIACLLFIIVVFALLICVDILPSRNAPSAFVPIVLIVFPVVFVFPFHLIYSVILVTEVVYVLALFHFKTPVMARNDFFVSLTALLVSATVAALVMRLRVDSYYLRSRYRDMSHRDPLTGILNKTSCEENVREYLSLRPLEQGCALLILDIDNFKAVNDHYGHLSGDDVLEVISHLLLQTFRGTDIIGRVGGDEFLVLMRDFHESAIVTTKCAQIAAGTELISSQLRLKISCSIGAAELRGISASYEQLYRSADDALYEAKAFGKGRCVVHSMKKNIRGNRPILLIADQDTDCGAALAGLFSGSFEILQADNARDTLTLVSQHQSRLAVILLDKMLPDEEYVLRYLKSRDGLKRLSVVLLVSADSQETAWSTEADAVVAKPIDPETLRTCVTELVENAGRARGGGARSVDIPVERDDL